MREMGLDDMSEKDALAIGEKIAKATAAELKHWARWAIEQHKALKAERLAVKELQRLSKQFSDEIRTLRAAAIRRSAP